MKFKMAGPVGAALLAASVSQAVGAAEFWDGKVKMKGYLSQGWQDISADGVSNGGVPNDIDSGFRRLRFNLTFNFQLSERISGYVELAEEPDDWEDLEIGQISQDLAFVDIKLMDWVLFRTGNIVTTVANYIPFSDGAMVQGNPLIGNSPIDYITAEEGAQLVGNHEIGNSLLKTVGWDFAVTNPSFFESFREENTYQYFGKVRFAFAHGLNIGGGMFYNDISDAFDTAGVNPVPALGLGEASAIWHGDGDDYNLGNRGRIGTIGNSRIGHAANVPGIDVFLWQLDALWTIPKTPVTLRAWGGMAEDDFRLVNAAGGQTTYHRGDAIGVVQQDSSVSYFGVEGKVKLPIKQFNTYLAARYSWADNTSEGATGDTTLDRIQVGGGWWANDSTLLKVEYVHQDEGANSPGNVNQEWGGVNAELSFTF